MEIEWIVVKRERERERERERRVISGALWLQMAYR
jgi:hypothetical protein